MKRTALLGLVSALAFGAPAIGQEDLVTDRPDQTESAATVSPGKVQIETGLLHTDDEGFEATEALGTLVRLGLAERLELRVGFDGYVSTSGPDGLGDASLGAKILLAEATDSAPQVAILLGSSVPVGDDRITSDDYAPFARLAMQKDLSESWGVGFNLGAEFPKDDEILLYTLAFGRGLDDKNSIFFEVFGDDRSSHSFDTGWTRLVRPNLQLDLAGGVGISQEAPDWFVGLGLSIRLPD